MPKVDQTTKQDRKERAFLTLRRFPLGLPVAELSEMTGIERRTLDNYLAELSTEGKVYKEDRSALWVALAYDQAQLRKFELSPEEAMTLYLAARLFTKQHDKRNEPAETALMKLATALRTDAHVGDEIHQAALELGNRPDDGAYNRVFRAVMQAYIYRRVLRITYEPAAGTAFDTDFAPYLIEPSAIGFTTYAIGHSSLVNAWRTFKIERIREAALTRQEYRIPPDFPGLDILRSAWSIMWGEKVVQVVLRFSPAVARRVMETRWHPSEEKGLDTDNPSYLRWSAQVADTTDMLPWIRGWGADVEVLEPKELREALTAEVHRMARRYGVSAESTASPQARVLRCWGKTGKTLEDFHPAVFHMFDVGHVAQAILAHEFASRWRTALADAFNTEADKLGDWLPYLVALHDIGKVSTAFQCLNQAQKARLEQEGFSFDGWDTKSDIYHATISQVYIADVLGPSSEIPDHGLIKACGEAMGGHHGQFIDPEVLKAARYKLRHEPDEWAQHRQHANAMLRNELLRCASHQLPQPVHLSKAVMALTGFTILCDWLGSDERYFHPMPDTDLTDYIEHSRNQAKRAVAEAGLLTAAASRAPVEVGALFIDLGKLRPLQHAIDDIPANILQAPSLTIIEAPTGEGKTEAALALAHRIARITGTDELYYALPTMATSNQMFGRLQMHLQKRLGLPASVKLVHGQSFLVEEDLRAELSAADVQPLGNGGNARQTQSDAPVAWFNGRKRALLAPFGVGTIDQAELAALNVKHTALRMMGLVGKVVIVDEVHAYDTYMTTVIARLLCWLATMNTSVILLSATLPKSRRKQLAEAYGTQFELSAEQADAYPGLLVVSANGIHHASPQVWQPNRVIECHELHWGDDDARAKAEWLLAAVKEGGGVCWMTNTVKRAQRIFAELMALSPEGVDLDLLHSQFPLDERQRREVRLTGKYGRTGTRPERGIVIGTQVLEQSLDLDFDVMVTDLAPIDLMLQRAGRLHRHDRVRPTANAVPRLWLNYEITAKGELKPGSDRTIYAEYIRKQTYEVLKGRTHIQLPRDYRVLVEAVYSDESPSEDSLLYDAWSDLLQQQQVAEGEAKKRLLPAPHPRDSFAQTAAMRIQFEEDENRADFIVAQTRLGEESLNVIPLERHGDSIYLDGSNSGIDVNQEARLDDQRRLLRRNLRVGNPQVVAAIRGEEENHPTNLFKKSTLLKGYSPLWLSNGQARFKSKDQTLHVALDPQLGLIIEKEGKAHDTNEN